MSKRTSRGFTLVELMVAVSIVGILATTAANTFQGRVNESHSVAAITTLASIRLAVESSYTQTDYSQDPFAFTSTVFGAPKSFGSGKSKNAKGNGSPAKKSEGSEEESEPEDAGGNNGKGTSGDGGIDGDGNNGHGNNESGCDPDNPGKSKNCRQGNDDGGDGDGDSGEDEGNDADEADEGNDADESDDGDSPTPTDGFTPQPTGRALCSSSQPVPQSIEQVRGRAFRASTSTWASGDTHSGWKCLHFSRSGAQRYQYGYTVGASSLPGAIEGYTAWARGDLDGDGRASLFQMKGAVTNDGIIHAPSVHSIDPAE